ncbi:site-2 protease family protein [Novosphingobium sp. BL-8A]|uniref:site-2 protease family protein n=1 Tax=Novosphingobium sp. BL-8A TaxID=3127639 RepID=UPI003757D0EC
MNQTLLQAAALIIPLILAIVFHEVAHGWTALALGDPTALEKRRLSLNPLRHVDPFGTLILPGSLALAGGPIFGWAKPVPVNRWRLRDPRRGMMVVAAAGPASNLVLAAIGAVLWGLSGRVVGVPDFAAMSFYYFIKINVFLALFNLLPIPPFDGSHIIEGLLPQGLADSYSKLRPYGFPLLIMLLLVVPYFFPQWGLVDRLVQPPVLWMSEHYYALAKLVAGV